MKASQFWSISKLASVEAYLKLSDNLYVEAGKESKFMKAVVALLLAVQVLASSLLPGFGVDQCAKLVDLVQHFQEHRQIDPTLSFLAFIEMHYGIDSEHQKHPNHSHHNLPAVGHSIPAFTPTLLSFLQPAAQPMLLLSRSACYGYANLYSFLSVCSLINPPRR